MKICKKCSNSKELEKFCNKRSEKDGKHRYCKECMCLTQKKEYIIDKVTHNKRTLKWHNDNKEYHKSQMKSHYQNNKSNYNEYWKQRTLEDPTLKIRHSVNAIINDHLQKYLLTKKDHSVVYLGCGMSEYILYLESKFTDQMTWENYGMNKYWEIDHIIPIDSFNLNNVNELRRCFHFSNTQPLSITENKIKSNKV